MRANLWKTPEESGAWDANTKLTFKVTVTGSQPGLLLKGCTEGCSVCVNARVYCTWEVHPVVWHEQHHLRVEQHHVCSNKGLIETARLWNTRTKKLQSWWFIREKGFTILHLPTEPPHLYHTDSRLVCRCRKSVFRFPFHPYTGRLCSCEQLLSASASAEASKWIIHAGFEYMQIAHSPLLAQIQVTYGNGTFKKHLATPPPRPSPASLSSSHPVTIAVLLQLLQYEADCTLWGGRISHNLQSRSRWLERMRDEGWTDGRTSSVRLLRRDVQGQHSSFSWWRNRSGFRSTDATNWEHAEPLLRVGHGTCTLASTAKHNEH